MSNDLRENRIIVKGNNADLIKLDNLFKQKHKEYCCSTHVISAEGLEDKTAIPKCLDYKVISGKHQNPLGTRQQWEGKEYRIICLDEIKEIEGYSFQNIIPITKEDFSNTLNGCIYNKWGIEKDIDSNDMYSKLKGRKLTYCFLTESSCSQIVKRMSELFPALAFKYKYCYCMAWHVDCYSKYKDGKRKENKYDLISTFIDKQIYSIHEWIGFIVFCVKKKIIDFVIGKDYDNDNNKWMS